MYESRVTTKGQVTIPAEFRQAFGIESGDSVAFEITADNLLIIKRAEPKAQAAGFLKSKIKQPVNDDAIEQAVRDGWKARASR